MAALPPNVLRFSVDLWQRTQICLPSKPASAAIGLINPSYYFEPDPTAAGIAAVTAAAVAWGFSQLNRSVLSRMK